MEGENHDIKVKVMCMVTLTPLEFQTIGHLPVFEIDLVMNKDDHVIKVLETVKDKTKWFNGLKIYTLNWDPVNPDIQLRDVSKIDGDYYPSEHEEEEEEEDEDLEMDESFDNEYGSYGQYFEANSSAPLSERRTTRSGKFNSNTFPSESLPSETNQCMLIAISDTAHATDDISNINAFRDNFPISEEFLDSLDYLNEALSDDSKREIKTTKRRYSFKNLNTGEKTEVDLNNCQIYKPGKGYQPYMLLNEEGVKAFKRVSDIPRIKLTKDKVDFIYSLRSVGRLTYEYLNSKFKLWILDGLIFSLIKTFMVSALKFALILVIADVICGLLHINELYIAPAVSLVIVLLSDDLFNTVAEVFPEQTRIGGMWRKTKKIKAVFLDMQTVINNLITDMTTTGGINTLPINEDRGIVYLALRGVILNTTTFIATLLPWSTTNYATQ